MNTKNILIIIGVIALFSIIVFVVLEMMKDDINNLNDSGQYSSIDIREWKTFSDPVKKISFKYPEDLQKTYIHTLDWPPQVQIVNEQFVCIDTGSETERAGQTATKIINSKTYCITKISESAGGSTYTQYAYATPIQNKVYYYTFTLRSVFCGNYDNPQKTACETERAGFDTDFIIDQIVETTISISE